jgi:hypothetical protein
VGCARNVGNYLYKAVSGGIIAQGVNTLKENEIQRLREFKKRWYKQAVEIIVICCVYIIIYAQIYSNNQTQIYRTYLRSYCVNCFSNLHLRTRKWSL